MKRAALAGVEAGVRAAIGAARFLVLPVSLLLFLQWPLRDLVRAWSREANDLAQWLFALYVGVALTYATRERAHLAADTLAARYNPRLRAMIARLGAILCVLPWSLWMLVAGWPIAWNSLRQLEAFPETYNPGYFLIKLAAWLMALLSLLQALLDAARPPPRP